MKHLKLFEEFLIESKLEKFYNTTVKNPLTDREVTTKTILSDPENPLYKKLKAIEDKLKEKEEKREDKYDPYRASRIKEVKEEIVELNDKLRDVQAEMNDMRDFEEEPDESRLQELEQEEMDLTDKLEELEEELADLKK